MVSRTCDGVVTIDRSYVVKGPSRCVNEVEWSSPSTATSSTMSVRGTRATVASAEPAGHEWCNVCSRPDTRRQATGGCRSRAVDRSYLVAHGARPDRHSSRRATTRGSGDPGCQELGAEADGGDADGRRRLSPVQ